MKILDYIKETYSHDLAIKLCNLVEQAQENTWCNYPKIGNYGMPEFAYRTMPIHNANGYQGDIAQFLWRANMDYHQLLTSEPQPMQQPQPTDYAAQLSAVKTLPELFDFRAKLKAELNSEFCAYMKVFADATTESAQSSQITEIKFFIARVESQIKSLENSGVFLAAVDVLGAVRDLDFSDKKPA